MNDVAGRLAPPGRARTAGRAGLAWGALGVLAFSVSLPATRLAVEGGLSASFVGAGRAVAAGLLALATLAVMRQPLPPARLLPRPEPVEAVGLLPDHPPRAFTWRRVRHSVLRADGPERISGEWWRRPGEVAAVRDYWAVETGDGRRFWLFRQGNGVDPATGGLAWFLHGFF